MKMNKLTLVPVFFTILILACASRAQQHPIGEDTKPPKRFERYYAAQVVDSDNPGGRKLYIGEYDYTDIKGTGGFSGSFDIEITAKTLDVVPGYMAMVCGGFVGTNRYTCLPHQPGQHKLDAFSNVGKITLSKVRRDDEVVMWYNTFPPTLKPVAVVFRLNTSYTMATPFPNPGRTWIPDGMWLRLCKSRTAGNRQCQTFTSDTGEIKGEFKVIEIGKGTPPPEPTRVIVPKPEMKPFPKQKIKTKRLP